MEEAHRAGWRAGGSTGLAAAIWLYLSRPQLRDIDRWTVAARYRQGGAVQRCSDGDRFGPRIFTVLETVIEDKKDETRPGTQTPRDVV